MNNILREIKTIEKIMRKDKGSEQNNIKKLSIMPKLSLLDRL